MSTRLRAPVAVWTALGTVYVCWGSVFLATGAMVAALPPLTSSGLRFALAGVLLLGVLALRRGRRRVAAARPGAHGRARRRRPADPGRQRPGGARPDEPAVGTDRAARLGRPGVGRAAAHGGRRAPVAPDPHRGRAGPGGHGPAHRARRDVGADRGRRSAGPGRLPAVGARVLALPAPAAAPRPVRRGGAPDAARRCPQRGARSRPRRGPRPVARRRPGAGLGRAGLAHRGRLARRLHGVRLGPVGRAALAGLHHLVRHAGRRRRARQRRPGRAAGHRRAARRRRRPGVVRPARHRARRAGRPTGLRGGRVGTGSTPRGRRAVRRPAHDAGSPGGSRAPGP